MNKAKKLNRFMEISNGNDIKYHPVFSYRHLRIFAWGFLIIASLGRLLNAGSELINAGQGLTTLFGIMESASSLMSPLFLLAAFAILLNAKDGYRRLFLSYGGLTLLVYIAFLFVYFHYIIGLFNIALGYEAAIATVSEFLSSVSPNGYIAFNIFIDLLLFTSVTFFLNYTPKTKFQGKKLYIFRLFALIPILYEVGSIVVKSLAGSGVFKIPPLAFPLLTTKPPVAFFIFVFLALFIKNREKFFIKRGKTHEDFKRFEDTNLNKLHFNLLLTFLIVIAAVVDFLLLFIVPLFSIIGLDVTEMEIEMLYFNMLGKLLDMGIGKTIPMLFIIPIIMFFDYKKTHKNPMIDMLIPVIGVGLLIFTTIEGSYLIFRGKLAEWIKESLENIANEG